MGEGGAANQSIQDGGGIKLSLQSRCRGGGAVFLDQLERRYCKDTPSFRPFYIGAPKGPFLPGLIITFGGCTLCPSPVSRRG
jgi:hypothetical protein